MEQVCKRRPKRHPKRRDSDATDAVITQQAGGRFVTERWRGTPESTAAQSKDQKPQRACNDAGGVDFRHAVNLLESRVCLHVAFPVTSK